MRPVAGGEVRGTVPVAATLLETAEVYMPVPGGGAYMPVVPLGGAVVEVATPVPVATVVVVVVVPA
jgi:hypothetical protein